MDSSGTDSIWLNKSFFGISGGTGGTVFGSGGSVPAQVGSVSGLGLATFNGVSSYAHLKMLAMTTPTNGTFSTAVTGGTLADATTYYYRVAATSAVGTTLASTETSITTGTGGNLNTVTTLWGYVVGATGYEVYGRTTGAELLLATITNPYTRSWVDDGSVTPVGALPAANTSLPGIVLNGGTAITTASSANTQLVTCSPGGSGTQYCGADGAWHTLTQGAVVANVASATYSGTSSLPSSGYTTFFTTTAAGFYRICGYGDITVAGTGTGTWQLGTRFVSDGQAAAQNLGNALTNATQWSNNIGTVSQCPVAYLDSGSTVGYALTAIGTITTQPTIRYSVALEYVSP